MDEYMKDNATALNAIEEILESEICDAKETTDLQN